MANSFAAQDRIYPDGQNNKEPVPDEIIEFGFVPPVRMPDGSISTGSKLAANHLNTLLNELYSKISTLEARVAALEGA
ncbi:phosphoglycolate phosphatase [Serratia ficaria]|uniref:phosphoglycolate phosphatase n=1 Tax=Serratia ficaria TaxID=61651 RepID=UPI0021B73358|nr:phosphoglycolate phosphatase [Serratia ficaria]